MFSDSPEEEEFALANSSVYSFYAWHYFPRSMKKMFQQFALFENQSEEIKTEWKKAYMKVLKRIALSGNGKRILIKNPVHTARVKILLEIFPDAKFIYLYRNPYTIYASTKQLYKKLLPIFTLQNISEVELEENIIYIYQQMLQKYLVDKKYIPPENLIEIRYEDFIGNEISYLNQVYSQFNLPGFKKVESEFNQYIESQTKYKTNKYILDEQTVTKIAKEWKFAIEKWEYDLPDNFKAYPST